MPLTSELLRLFQPDQLQWQLHPTQPLLMQVFESRTSEIGYDAVLVKLLPGDRIGWHVHDQATETVYIVDGAGQIFAALNEPDQANAEGERLYSGMVITIPIGVRHALTNTGQQPLLIFAIHAPATL